MNVIQVKYKNRVKYTVYDVFVLQLESLQGEAEKLQDTKPEEAQIIREKIAEINNVWMDLKDMVSSRYVCP